MELTVYAIDATLTLYRMTDDSDYHLVVTDPAGKTMIAELPHPDCVGSGSPFKAAITSARAAFNAQLRATSTFKAASVPVRIHGVGFMDSIHGQTGVAPNGIELHPVLKIEFNPKGLLKDDPQFLALPDSDRLFNWAEAAYPSLFPKPGASGVYDQYTYRYFPVTGNYVATTRDGRVVVHNGRDWVLLDLGALGEFWPKVLKAGY